MVDIQTISVVIAAASVVVGVVTFILNSRKEVQQKQDQMILQRFQGYSTEYTRAWADVRNVVDWENGEEFQQKYSRVADPEFHSKWLYVLWTYNMAGISLATKCSDLPTPIISGLSQRAATILSGSSL